MASLTARGGLETAAVRRSRVGVRRPEPIHRYLGEPVLRGVVQVTAGAEAQTVAAPGAAYIPGGATTRSLRALEPSLILAVLCKGESGNPPATGA